MGYKKSIWKYDESINKIHDDNSIIGGLNQADDMHVENAEHIVAIHNASLKHCRSTKEAVLLLEGRGTDIIMKTLEVGISDEDAIKFIEHGQEMKTIIMSCVYDLSTDWDIHKARELLKKIGETDN